MTNQVITNMLAGYRCRSDADHVNAIREIMHVYYLFIQNSKTPPFSISR